MGKVEIVSKLLVISAVSALNKDNSVLCMMCRTGLKNLYTESALNVGNRIFFFYFLTHSSLDDLKIGLP